MKRVRQYIGILAAGVAVAGDSLCPDVHRRIDHDEKSS